MKRRRLVRSGPTEFSTLRDAQAITTAFDALRRYRSARFKAIGAPDVLDNEAIFRFYRRMAIEGAQDGSARTECLSLAGEPIAVQFGLVRQDVYSMLMIGLDIARHARLSPGLLAIEDSIRSAIEAGDRVYDFTIGDHPYKLQFGAEHGAARRVASRAHAARTCGGARDRAGARGEAQAQAAADASQERARDGTAYLTFATRLTKAQETQLTPRCLRCERWLAAALVSNLRGPLRVARGCFAVSQVELMLQEKIERMPDQPLRLLRPAAAPQPPADDPRVDLKELIRVMQRRRKLILWVAAVPVLLALVYGLIATPLYTTSTQILIDPRDRRIVSNEVTPENLAADGGVAVVESQLLVITSDTVLRRAIVREHLDTDPEFGGAATGLAGLMRDALATVGLGGEGGDAELKALRQLKKRIGVKRSEKAFVAEVYVTSEGREKSVRIADAVAQAYLDDQTESRASASGRASAALGGRLDALRTRVQEAEDRVVQYKEQHKLVAAGNVLVSDQQLSEMTLQLNTARGKTAEARARYDQIIRARQSGVESGAIPEAVLSQTIGQLRTQYAEVARQRAELGALVGPRHPSITNLDAQIQGVQKLINEELVAHRDRGAQRSRTHAGKRKGARSESRCPEAEVGRDQPGFGAVARARARSRSEPRDLSVRSSRARAKPASSSRSTTPMRA